MSTDDSTVINSALICLLPVIISELDDIFSDPGKGRHEWETWNEEMLHVYWGQQQT